MTTRADQLGLKRGRKEANEADNEKDGATSAAPKRKGRPPARNGKGRGRGRSAVEKGPMREQATSAKDVPKMVPVKRAHECEQEPSAPVVVQEGPVSKRKTKSGKGKGKKAKCGESDCADGRPAMLAVPVPEEVGKDDDASYSAPVWTGDGENCRPSLAVCSAETGSAAASEPKRAKKVRRKRSKAGKRSRAVRDAANDGEFDPEPADNEERAPDDEECAPHHPLVPMEAEDVPSLEVEFNYPKTFAGRPCPVIEGNKGWLLWRHIVRSFKEIIAPNILDRSRTKREAAGFVNHTIKHL